MHATGSIGTAYHSHANARGRSAPNSTIGTLEVGGASLQVAFIPASPPPAAQSWTLHLGGGLSYTVYVESYMYYGLTEAKYRYNTSIWDAGNATELNPCFLSCVTRGLCAESNRLTHASLCSPLTPLFSADLAQWLHRASADDGRVGSAHRLSTRGHGGLCRLRKQHHPNTEPHRAVPRAAVPLQRRAPAAHARNVPCAPQTLTLPPNGLRASTTSRRHSCSSSCRMTTPRRTCRARASSSARCRGTCQIRSDQMRSRTCNHATTHTTQSGHKRITQSLRGPSHR